MGKVLLELAVLLIFDKISVETIIKQKNLDLTSIELNTDVIIRITTSSFQVIANIYKQLLIKLFVDVV